MCQEIERQSRFQSLTISSGTAESDAFSLEDMTMAIVHMPAAWDAADIGFMVSSTADGTFLPLYSEAGTLIVISGPVADRAYAFPARVAPARYVKLWSNLASVAENQTAARTLIVDLKA